MTPITEQEAVRMGMEFRRLTNSPDFDTVIEMLKHQYQSQISGSDLADKAGREASFQQIRSLDELITTFNTFIAIAEADILDAPFDEDNIFE